MPCSRPWKPGSGTPLGARLKGLIFHDRRVEFLRIWSQERPGQACVPAASVGWGWWRPEARGQSGSGRCWKGGQARAVLRRSDGGLWGRTGCPHCWSCSQRTRRSWWACPHTTCPVRWPLPILMAGLPRPPPPLLTVSGVWLRRWGSLLGVSGLHPSFARSRSLGFSVSLAWFRSLCPWASFPGPHPQGLLGRSHAQASPPPGLVSWSL